MKKILTLLLCITAVPSFAVTGDLYCQYRSTNQIASGTVTGTFLTIKGTTFLVDDKKMMSYDVPFSKCPRLDNKNQPLVGIVAKVGNELYPILNTGIKDGPDFTKNLNIYAGGIISLNALQTLQYMLDNRTNFKQYEVDYERTEVNLQINGVQYVLHKEGKSAIYNQMPTNYNEANDTLMKFLMGMKLDSNLTINAKEARAISDFITRYDNQAGLGSLSDSLAGMGETAFSLNLGFQMPTINIVISKKNINTITLGLSYIKDYRGFMGKNQSEVINEPMHVFAKIPVTIDLSSYNPDISTNKLNVSVDGQNPYENFAMLSYPNGTLGELIKQSVFSANINTVSAALSRNFPKNTDKFSIK